MKTYTFLFSMLLVPFFGFAQDASVQDLKNKVNALELVVKAEQEKNAYLKNALDLRNSGIEVGKGDISMRVTKIIGNTEEQRIYVQGIVTYKGEIRQDLQFQSHDLVSPNGNQYKGHSSGLPNNQNETFHVVSAEAGIPYGFSIKVDKVEEKIPTLALLRLRLYGNGLRGLEFDFKGLMLFGQINRKNLFRR